jgi:hypothetical protein
MEEVALVSEWGKYVHVGEKKNTCKFIKGLVRNPAEIDCL